MTDVKSVARWTGWCDPCETERPLVLTETGERGIRAWLRGIGHEDRALRVTCCVCGQWQDVPPAEEDVVEAPLARVIALHPLGVTQVVVHAVSVSHEPATPAAPVTSVSPVTSVTSVPVPRVSVTDTHTTLALVAGGLDLIAMAS